MIRFTGSYTEFYKFYQEPIHNLIIHSIPFTIPGVTQLIIEYLGNVLAALAVHNSLRGSPSNHTDARIICMPIDCYTQLKLYPPNPPLKGGLLMIRHLPTKKREVMTLPIPLQQILVVAMEPCTKIIAFLSNDRMIRWKRQEEPGWSTLQLQTDYLPDTQWRMEVSTRTASLWNGAPSRTTTYFTSYYFFDDTLYRNFGVCAWVANSDGCTTHTVSHQKQYSPLQFPSLPCKWHVPPVFSHPYLYTSLGVECYRWFNGVSESVYTYTLNQGVIESLFILDSLLLILLSESQIVVIDA